MNKSTFSELANWIDEWEELDIVLDGVLTSAELAKIVWELRKRMDFYGTKIVRYFVIVKGKNYYIKLNNNYKGFVSVSTCDETGVSRTEYYPYKVEEDDPSDIPALANLAEMINEAWYNLNS